MSTQQQPTDRKQAEDHMRSVIQRIATGPELSKDISLSDAHLAMRYVLEDLVDPIQAGIFLIALRMKRETAEENKGVLQALIDHTRRVTADVEEVLDVADPFDGYRRCLPVAPFLPPLLAACGIPTVSNGAQSLGPKYGVTHHQVLRAAGINVDLTVEAAARRLADPEIGWAYLDQSASCPALHALVRLRDLIVKRPCITTVETLLRPLSGQRATHLVTGYVHKAYPAVYTMLARYSGYTSASVVRGVEGGVIPSLQQPAKWYRYTAGSSDVEQRTDPAEAGVMHAEHRAPLWHGEDAEAVEFDAQAVARAAALAGQVALDGAPGPVRDALIYAAAVCLAHLGRSDSLAQAAGLAREALDSGAARQRFLSHGS